MKHCDICSELKTDNAIGNDGSTFHKCQPVALRRAAYRCFENARDAVLYGRPADAFVWARNAYWFRRAAGDMPRAPAPAPRETTINRARLVLGRL